MNFCNNLTSYSRYKTRVVTIGDVPMGGDFPIRVQSMTTTDTMDTLATVEQSIRIIEAGGEYVRITAPSIKEAKNLENIKNELRKRGYNAPLVADIHFTPNAAEIAARIVEKVRVNPGNYADKKKFEFIEYTDAAYNSELQRIREKFLPLVRICKEYGTAMRIGTNHGSLSDRIMSRYGDTPLGMVESAMEFLRICEDENYFNIVLSMKASNPQVMVQAYRMLVQHMMQEGMNYPLHLGVTEAGEGEDGRVKSAVGIGTLLEDGLGDTVRVSLTEDPEFEIPVAKALVDRYNNRRGASAKELVPEREALQLWNPYRYSRRETQETANFGGSNVPRVIADVSDVEFPVHHIMVPFGYKYSLSLDKWNLSDFACDYIFAGDRIIGFDVPGTLGIIYNYNIWKEKFTVENGKYPLFKGKQYFDAEKKSAVLNFVSVDSASLTDEFISRIGKDSTVVIVAETDSAHGMAELRQIFLKFEKEKLHHPIILKKNYKDLTEEQLQLHASTDLGALLVDGFGDGVWISAQNCGSARNINSTAFNILQATRTRISKTEYISCPSCGRTLFDLQETTAKIRSRTDHLKGVKIAIMGCIVNGPGEMADADYGYVGSGVGKITLYKGKEVVKRSLDSKVAVDELINLIKEDGNWVEPKQVDSRLVG